MAYLTPEEFATERRVATDSVYRWIKTGAIPNECVERIGRKMWIKSDAWKEHQTRRSQANQNRVDEAVACA